MVAEFCEYIKTHWTTYFKKLNFTVHEYFNKAFIKKIF